MKFAKQMILVLLLAGGAWAGTEKLLYNLKDGSDSGSPYDAGRLVRDSSGNFYATTYQGGIGNPRQVSTGWWGGWHFGTTVHLPEPSLPGSILVVEGISNDECMQAVVDDAKRPFVLSYQHKSPDGFQCEERWCLRAGKSTSYVRVWGSAIWSGVRHSVSLTEFPAGSARCNEAGRLAVGLTPPY